MHVGILAHSTDGVALCFLESVREASRHLGPDEHPEITLSILPMGPTLGQYARATRGRGELRHLRHRHGAERHSVSDGSGGAQIIAPGSNGASTHGQGLSVRGAGLPPCRTLGTDVLGGQSYGGCDCGLTGVGTHERQFQGRHPGSKEPCRRDVNGVECSKRMFCNQDLGGLQHFTGDLDQRPELTIDDKALQDLGHSLPIKRAVSHSTAQDAPQLHRHQG